MKIKSHSCIASILSDPAKKAFLIKAFSLGTFLLIGLLQSHAIAMLSLVFAGLYLLHSAPKTQNIVFSALSMCINTILIVVQFFYFLVAIGISNFALLCIAIYLFVDARYFPKSSPAKIISPWRTGVFSLLLVISVALGLGLFVMARYTGMFKSPQTTSANHRQLIERYERKVKKYEDRQKALELKERQCNDSNLVGLYQETQKKDATQHFVPLRYAGKFVDVAFIACVDKNDPRIAQAEQFIQQEIASCIAHGNAEVARRGGYLNSDASPWAPKDCETRGVEDDAKRQLNITLHNKDK